MYQHASIKQNLLYSITEPTQELLSNVPDICCSGRLGFLASYFDSSTLVRSPLGNHPSHLWLSRSQQECFKPLSFVTGSGICDIVNRWMRDQNFFWNHWITGIPYTGFKVHRRQTVLSVAISITLGGWKVFKKWGQHRRKQDQDPLRLFYWLSSLVHLVCLFVLERGRGR